jgi:hypothetical protein
LLAGQEVLHLPGEVVEAHVVLDAERHPYLRDHQIDGEPVLPLAFALELMAEVAASAEPTWHVTRVSDLRMFSGVILKEGRRALLVRCEPMKKAHRAGRQPDRLDGDWRVRISDPARPVRPFYEATIRMGAATPVPPAIPAFTGISSDSPVTAKQAYKEWLFHGPHFQVIERIHGLTPMGLDAILQPGCPRRCVGAGSAEDHGWLINPTIVDAGPQAAILWSRAHHGTVALPNRVKAYHRYGPMNDGPVRMVWRIDPGSDAHEVRATVWFLQNEKVIGHLEGLEGAASAELVRTGGKGQ